jgi:hypothetical protein
MERQQLLPVGNIPNGLPASGEEYLAMVRQEALRLPDWTRTTKDFKKDLEPTLLEDVQAIFEEKEERFLVPDKLLPTEGWKQRRIEDFNQYKINLHKVTKLAVHGEVRVFMRENDAKIGYTLNWNQPKVIRLLEQHIEWLNNPTLRMIRWIYILLLRCDPLMESNDQHKLRDLLKKLQQVRYGLKESDSFFITLTLCILVLSTVFGQRDLGDPCRLELQVP